MVAEVGVELESVSTTYEEAFHHLFWNPGHGAPTKPTAPGFIECRLVNVYCQNTPIPADEVPGLGEDDCEGGGLLTTSTAGRPHSQPPRGPASDELRDDDIGQHSELRDRSEQVAQTAFFQPKLPIMIELDEEIVIPDGLEDSPIDVRFRRFHQMNPHVYRAIRHRAFQLWDQGFERASMNEIFEHLRYRWNQRTRGEPFKLNNDYRACYARMLAQDPDRLPAGCQINGGCERVAAAWRNAQRKRRCSGGLLAQGLELPRLDLEGWRGSRWR